MNMLSDSLINRTSLVSDRKLSKNITLGHNSLGEGRKIKFVVSCDHSIQQPSLFFDNRLKSKDGTTQDSDFAIKIIRLHNSEVEENDIPLEIDSKGEPTLYIKKKRIRDILKCYSLDQTATYLKCYVKQFDYKRPKDLFRAFVIRKNEVWDVVLLDPYHLVADTKAPSEFKDRTKNARYDIKDIFSRYK